MTIGPVSAWLVWGVLALALTGAWAILWAADRGIRGLWQQWCYHEESSDTDLDTEACDAAAPDGDHCWFDEGHEGLHSWEQRLEELPPERTWEQMTSHQLPVADAELCVACGRPALGYARDKNEGRLCHTDDRRCYRDHFAPERERRAPWWEAEHRAAYESLGFDYPSGLVARVRELTP